MSALSDLQTRIKVASTYLTCAAVCERIDATAAGVRRVIESRGEDPDDHDDYQRMIENPARHYFGWAKVPTEWPLGPEDWRPQPTTEGNIALALEALGDMAQVARTAAVYVVEERRRDGDNREYWDPLGDYYATRAQAQDYADERNREHNERRRRTFDREMEQYEQLRAEHEALAAAGLRSEPFPRRPPEWSEITQYQVDEIEVIQP